MIEIMKRQSKHTGIGPESAIDDGFFIPANYTSRKVVDSEIDTVLLPEIGIETLDNLSVARFKTLWQQVSRSSTINKAGDLLQRPQMIDFDIDIYNNGAAPVTLNVKCLLSVRNQKNESKNIYSAAAGNVLKKSGALRKWTLAADMHRTAFIDSNSVIDLLRNLFMQSTESPKLISAAPNLPDGPTIAKATQQLTSLLNSLAADDGEDKDAILVELRNHFARYSFPDALKNVVDNKLFSADVLQLAFEHLMAEAAEIKSYRVPDYLLELAASHPRASMRYAAVQALSLHLDDKIRTVLSVRYKDEHNRTVAASISAAIR